MQLPAPLTVPTGYTPVDAYTFPEQFPALTSNNVGTCTGCTRPNLWLAEIDHTGYVVNATAAGAPGGTLVATTMPAVYTYGNDLLPNRASSSQLINQGVLDRYRMYELTNELGSEIAVSYGQANISGTNFGCSGGAPTPATNTTLCYPEYSPNPSGSGQVIDWFNKYVVTQVSQYDNTGISPTRTTTFTYLGTPAWHTDDSEQVQSQYRTYDDFRGFGQVQAVTGTGTAGSNNMSLTTYFRGMDSDPTASVTLASATHPSISMRDDNALAGQVFETETFASDASALTSTPVTDEIDLPVDPRTIVTATHVRSSGLPAQNAHFSQTAKKYTFSQSASQAPAVIAAGGIRKTEIDYTYQNTVTGVDLPVPSAQLAGNNGELSTVDDLGDNSAPGAGDGTVPETCTLTQYASPAAGSDPADPITQQWTDYPYLTAASVVPKGGSCTQSVPSPANTTSMAQTTYDGVSTGVIGGPGDVTLAQSAKAFNANGTPQWVTTTSMLSTDPGHDGYDVYGRATRTTDNLGRTSTTGYSPPTGAVPYQVSTTNPAGWTSSAVVDQGRGLTLHTVDVNGQTTDQTYDGLGDATAVWIQGHSEAAYPAQPDFRFTDQLYGTLPRRTLRRARRDGAVEQRLYRNPDAARRRLLRHLLLPILDTASATPCRPRASPRTTPRAG